jgi:hypothetical protein
MNPSGSSGKHCILLFEDFDRYLEDAFSKAKMSNVLNAMDGITTDVPSIRIFTGNSCEVIFSDSAMTKKKNVTNTVKMLRS